MRAHIASFSVRAWCAIGRRIYERDQLVGEIKRRRRIRAAIYTLQFNKLITDTVKSVSFLEILTGDSGSVITVYSDWLKID